MLKMLLAMWLVRTPNGVSLCWSPSAFFVRRGAFLIKLWMNNLFLKVAFAFLGSIGVLYLIFALVYFLSFKWSDSAMSWSAGFWSSVASVTAVVALGFGFHQFDASSEAQKESAAVSLYYDYTKLMLEYGDKENVSESYIESIGSAVLVSGESIFLMRKDKPGWVETVKFMISRHSKIFVEGDWNCATLDREFYELISENISCLENE